jgi:site-specific DNA recombinase
MNAVLYARYSSHNQQEQSIEGQLRDCYAYAEREGLSIVGEYCDRALTGRSDDRPEFQRMIADASKKQFSFIIVWKLDRFSRNRYDSAIYKARLKKHNVKVISATENITNEPEGIMLEGLLESMAEYYSANLAKHIKRGLRESAINGTWTGGRAPLGYRLVDRKLVIDEEKAAAVRYAFEQYAKGVPKKQIVSALNAKGLRNTDGKPVTLTTLAVVFKNRKYIGEFTFDGMEVSGGSPRILDDATFYKVQDRLAAVHRAPAESKANVEYLLRGKAYCGHCGARMVGECGRSRTGDIYHYYSCADKKKKHTCKKKSEKKDFIEWYVVEQTCLYVLDPARIDFIAERIVEAYDKEFDISSVKELERKIAKLDKEANAAVEALIAADNKAVKARLQKKLEEIELQKADIEIDLSKLKIAVGIRYTKEQVVAWLKTFCKGDPLDENFRRRIIDVFINSIYLYDDKTVVFYNIRDGKQVSYIDVMDAMDELSEDEATPPGSESKVRISNTLLHQKKTV